jgi:ribosomal protein S17E
MSIQAHIKELDSIKSEIKRNMDATRILRVRSKTIENEIAAYLEHKEQDGVKFKNKSFVLENSVSYKRKPKKDKEDETKRFLRGMGIHDADEAYTNLLTVQKGEAVETKKLRVKTHKKKIEY